MVPAAAVDGDRIGRYVADHVYRVDHGYGFQRYTASDLFIFVVNENPKIACVVLPKSLL